MLTYATESTVAQMTTDTQNETLPSDVEIMRRVNAIRSNWTMSEKLQRRRAAEERFENLIDALCLAEAA
ncbi:hypothetical protein LF1_24850 [Rubripirellula obstinata]|uniref:Uncharacterized protein n=1 Tax=Rubripirellula obstinata TaxID=406547 RepID=A0A5B1CFG6_9BACT|nr:hypothetical protein [Rubripirellula obstinata]KAA1259947.1 hypothetical protein LF1_24850 [Rubripirellula obstinata]